MRRVQVGAGGRGMVPNLKSRCSGEIMLIEELVVANILVRNVDDDALARLKKKAKAAGTSLNEIARQALLKAAKPSKEEAWAAADRLRAKIRARVGHDLPDSTPGIRQDRDTR